MNTLETLNETVTQLEYCICHWDTESADDFRVYYDTKTGANCTHGVHLITRADFLAAYGKTDIEELTDEYETYELAAEYVDKKRKEILATICAAHGVKENTRAYIEPFAAAAIYHQTWETAISDFSETEKLDAVSHAFCAIHAICLRVEERTGKPLTPANAAEICAIVTNLLEAAQIYGTITFATNKEDENGELIPCSLKEATEAELRAESVSFTLFGKGHYTADAEQLGGDLMARICNICHMTATGGDRDNKIEWTYIDLTAEA